MGMAAIPVAMAAADPLGMRRPTPVIQSVPGDGAMESKGLYCASQRHPALGPEMRAVAFPQEMRCLALSALGQVQRP